MSARPGLSGPFSIIALGLFLLLGGIDAAHAGAASSGAYNYGSVASEFLQSKTLANILSREDLAAPTCSNHHWLKATVVSQPVSTTRDSVTERKWTERWFFDRCGKQVFYWVFFTEVGQGGAYMSLIDPK
jgi:hypothetical protein